MKEIIYNEILILRKVKNQNIYKMYDAFEDHEYLYIVVELLSGPAINKVILFYILIFKRDGLINVLWNLYKILQ